MIKNSSKKRLRKGSLFSKNGGWVGMRKIVLITLIILIVTSIFALTTGFSIYRYYKKTPGGLKWWEETNPIIADATATGSWNTGGYIILPATPNYYQVPQQITLSVEISQWIYLKISYTNFDIHVNMPGDYAINNLNITIKTNGGINIYFNTGGNLNDGNGHTIPTWLGYLENSNQATLPPLGSSNTSFAWTKIGDLPKKSDFITILKPYGTILSCGLGKIVYKIWFGFRVNDDVCKGDYTTWADIYIQSDP